MSMTVTRTFCSLAFQRLGCKKLFGVNKRLQVERQSGENWWLRSGSRHLPERLLPQGRWRLVASPVDGARELNTEDLHRTERRVVSAANRAFFCAYRTLLAEEGYWNRPSIFCFVLGRICLAFTFDLQTPFKAVKHVCAKKWFQPTYTSNFY